MSRRYAPPEGWTLQAFCFALEPTPQQWTCAARFFGARRTSFNWALEQITDGIDHYHESGEESGKPSLYGLRKQWNTVKSELCVDQKTGEVWWPAISKEVFADGIRGAVDGYWRWQKSRAGDIFGKRVGFPTYKKKGRDHDRCTFTTGAMRLEQDRRHLTLPVIGTLRTCENTRKLERLVSSDRARILSVTLSRRGLRLVASVKVAVLRPQQAHVLEPDSVVGVDVGVRRLATIATPERVITVVDNPAPLHHALAELRRLNRQLSRRTKGSRQWLETRRDLTRAHARVANIRKHHIHSLTSCLAKTHGTVVVEGLDVRGMLQQKGLPGARARRRGLSDAALGEPRRQLRYKCSFYGSTLVEADRFFPSSKTCHVCGNVQDIGWSEHWTCEQCDTAHQRDDNAAINLARLNQSASLGSVGAPVKRGAEHQTGLRPAAGEDTRKGELVTAGSNNSVRSAA